MSTLPEPPEGYEFTIESTDFVSVARQEDGGSVPLGVVNALGKVVLCGLTVEAAHAPAWAFARSLLVVLNLARTRDEGEVALNVI